MTIYCVINTESCNNEIYNDIHCFETKQQALNYIELLYQEYYIDCQNNQYTDIDEYEPGETYFQLIDEENDTLHIIELKECEIR